MTDGNEYANVCKIVIDPNLAMFNGIGPLAPVVTSPNGAKQSASPYRADLLPMSAVLDVASILKRGADKYGEDNWRGLTVEDNINHALVHLMAYQAGDKQDNHLGNAACRALFALELAITTSRENMV